MGKRAIYSCITLQKELENTIKKMGFDGKVTYLNVALHSNPQKMHETLQRIIDENTEAEEIVICVSGCGKATCDLKATTCPIAVPRTMDCIDVLLTGSGIKRPDGAIFITKSWMNFMKNSTIDYAKLVQERGQAEADTFLKQMYKGFTDFYIIDTGRMICRRLKLILCLWWSFWEERLRVCQDLTRCWRSLCLANMMIALLRYLRVER